MSGGQPAQTPAPSEDASSGARGGTQVGDVTPRAKNAATVDDLPPPGRESLRQRLSYWGYRAAWDSVAHLPELIVDPAPAAVGRLWATLGSAGQRAQLRANLARVMGHPSTDVLDRAVDDAYRSYTRYWMDSFRLHTMEPATVMANSDGHQLALVDDMVADGDGGILATAHLGSWDIGAMFTTERNWNMAVVAEVVEPRRLFDRFVDLRRQAGIDVFPLVRGGDMVDRMAGAVQRGGLATLLADRDLGRRGPIVEFFGEPCRLPAGTAVLARRTGRPVATGAFLARGPGEWTGHIQSRIDVSELSVVAGTQAIAHELEAMISQYPDQWHVFVPNWLVDREPDHPVAVSWRETGSWPTGWDPEAQQ